VRGLGEHLPFRAEAFDAVLSFWSLNHCSLPSRVLSEAGRVLRRRGRLLLVLDDVAPGWLDILRGDYRGPHGTSTRLEGLRRKCRSLVGGWPRQPDHLEIADSDVRRWVSGFEVTRRFWAGGANS
jgi:SAM-dependent methyltransferase